MIKRILLYVIVLLEAGYAQSFWNIKAKGISLYSDLISFSQSSNLSKNDIKSGNFSFGIQYYFQLFPECFYYTPGLNFSYLEINGSPFDGYFNSKPIYMVPFQAEILLPIIFPVSIEWHPQSHLSVLFSAGISLNGKYNIATQKSGTVLDGDNVNVYTVNTGFKVDIFTNLSAYCIFKYYFGDNYKYQNYYNHYKFKESKISIVNVGLGISCNLFEAFESQRQNELLIKKNDSLDILLNQKNIALGELKRTLLTNEDELANSKAALENANKIIKSLKPPENKNDKIIIDIDSLNNEYNAKFYTNISFSEFLTANFQNLSDEGKALVEGYYEVAKRIQINRIKGIELKILVPQSHYELFSEFINNMSMTDMINIISNDDFNYIRIEFDIEKISKKSDIKFEIREK